MITKEQLILGMKMTKPIIISDYEFVLRALNSNETAIVASIQTEGLEIEANPKSAEDKKQIKLKVSEFLRNKNNADYVMLSMAIVNEKWTVEDLKQLSTETINTLVKTVNELSLVTGTSVELMQKFLE